jgi:NAD(P)-dependent dehydrogenase (short-subunit alcohol dehydrogenase family)
VNRLENKVAIVVGAGQTAGDTMGNGRAVAMLFAREGAQLFLVDSNVESAEETRKMIADEGGVAAVFRADISRHSEIKAFVDTCVDYYGRIDLLVNNVGTGTGDRGPVELAEEDWDNIFNVNLKSVFLTCKYVLPHMELLGKGVIINISSVAAVCRSRILAYKSSKAGLNALTHAIAMQYAEKGIRVNAIMPGLLETPMAIENIATALKMDKEMLIQRRNQAIPLKGGMGDAWDTAYAALFLASDEAKFITSVCLPVDGGQSAKIG